MAEEMDEFQHPKFAEMYIRQSAKADARGETAHRARLLAGLAGRVIEVGVGNGRNFAHYPPEVTEVLAVEPEAMFRAAAEEAAVRARVPVTVLAGHAGALPAEDGSVDAVVFSLVLCSVPDQAGALAEAARVLAPGGELRIYEHVRSKGFLRGLVQDSITPVWRRSAGGCTPNRRTREAIGAAGFSTDEIEDVYFAFERYVPKSLHLLGRAVRNPGT